VPTDGTYRLKIVLIFLYLNYSPSLVTHSRRQVLVQRPRHFSNRKLQNPREEEKMRHYYIIATDHISFVRLDAKKCATLGKSSRYGILMPGSEISSVCVMSPSKVCRESIQDEPASYIQRRLYMHKIGHITPRTLYLWQCLKFWQCFQLGLYLI
jgi:hypothetical protein